MISSPLRLRKVARLFPLMANHSIESGHHWKYSHNLSTVLTNNLSRALIEDTLYLEVGQTTQTKSGFLKPKSRIGKKEIGNIFNLCTTKMYKRIPKNLDKFPTSFLFSLPARDSTAKCILNLIINLIISVSVFPVPVFNCEIRCGPIFSCEIRCIPVFSWRW